MVLFRKSKKNKSQVKARAGAADTLITRDTKITGNIAFKGVLYIDGHVVGNVSADEHEMSLLTIGKHGMIEGHVEVPHVVILGRVKGDVDASEHIELESSAHVEGDVYYKLIEMAMGAEVNGKLVHRDDQPKLLNHDSYSPSSDAETPSSNETEPSSTVKPKSSAKTTASD